MLPEPLERAVLWVASIALTLALWPVVLLASLAEMLTHDDPRWEDG